MEDTPVIYKRRTRTPLSEIRWNELERRQNSDDQASTSSSGDDESEDVALKGRSYSLRSGSKRPRLLSTSARGRRRRKGHRTRVQTPTKTPAKTPKRGALRTPTKSSTETPTKASTATPTKASTATPTKASIATPTKASTATPTKASTATPTKAPIETPTRTPTGRKNKKAHVGDADQQVPDTPESSKPDWMLTPEEFVKEKRAMFAAIDSFELESEEESDEEKGGNARTSPRRPPAPEHSSISRSVDDLSRGGQVDSLQSESADGDSVASQGREEAEDMDIGSPSVAGDFESTDLQSKLPEPGKISDTATVSVPTENEADGSEEPERQKENVGITVIDLREGDPHKRTSDARGSNAVIMIDSGSDGSPRAPARYAGNTIALDSDDETPDSFRSSEPQDVIVTRFGDIGLSSCAGSDGGGMVQSMHLEEQVEEVATGMERQQEIVEEMDVAQEPTVKRIDKGKAIIVEPDEEIPESSRAGERRNRRRWW